MKGEFADRVDMQNRLFAELSRMFGKEVPLYDKSLAVNRVCNRAVCDLLSQVACSDSRSRMNNSKKPAANDTGQFGSGGRTSIGGSGGSLRRLGWSR